MTNTDRPRYAVCSNRPHLAIAAMRPNNIYGVVQFSISLWHRGIIDTYGRELGWVHWVVFVRSSCMDRVLWSWPMTMCEHTGMALADS